MCLQLLINLIWHSIYLVKKVIQLNKNNMELVEKSLAQQTLPIYVSNIQAGHIQNY